MEILTFIKPNFRKVIIFLILSALVLFLPIFLSWYSEYFCIRDMMLNKCMTPRLDVNWLYNTPIILPVVIITYFIACITEEILPTKNKLNN